MNDYCERLISYVIANSSKNREQSVEYLDSNCPAWRDGKPPQAGVIEVDVGDAD